MVLHVWPVNTQLANFYAKIHVIGAVSRRLQMGRLNRLIGHTLHKMGPVNLLAYMNKAVLKVLGVMQWGECYTVLPLCFYK